MDGKQAIVSVLCTLFVACGGAAPATGGAGAGGSAAATTPSTGAATAATASGAGSAGASGPKFADLLSAAKNAEYKITYKISASGAGTEAFGGEQTWYFKPPRARFDFAMSQGDQKLTISYFSLPDGT